MQCLGTDSETLWLFLLGASHLAEQLHGFAAKTFWTVENDREAISYSAQQSQSFRASPTNKTAFDCTR
jgi:hypothetical protein